MHGNQVDRDSELSNHVLIMYLPRVWTNLLLNISAKTLGKSQYANQSVACWLLTLEIFKGENIGVNKT